MGRLRRLTMRCERTLDCRKPAILRSPLGTKALGDQAAGETCVFVR